MNTNHKPIVMPGHVWRREFAGRLDEAAQRAKPMVYTRHGKPKLVIIVQGPESRSAVRSGLQQVTALFNQVFEQSVVIYATDPTPVIQSNSLRRDVNEMFQHLNTQLQPHVLTRYWDEIGYAIPVPAGCTMGQVDEFCQRYYTHD